jgi:hypothetical protein
MPIHPHTKLSKLQRFILTEAFKAWSTNEQTARMINPFVARLKPDAAPIQAGDLAHISRIDILIAFFGLSLRKSRSRWAQELGDDDVINRIDRQSAGQEVFNRANASLYRTLARLEQRGLIKRMAKRSDWQLTPEGIEAKQMTKRSDWQLTQEGINVAGELAKPKAI